MNTRAALRALGLVAFIVVGMIIVILPATFGLYVDDRNQRRGPGSALVMIFLAIGLAAVASDLSQMDTKSKRAAVLRRPPPLDPRAPDRPASRRQYRCGNGAVARPIGTRRQRTSGAADA